MELPEPGKKRKRKRAQSIRPDYREVIETAQKARRGCNRFTSLCGHARRLDAHLEDATTELTDRSIKAVDSLTTLERGDARALTEERSEGVRSGLLRGVPSRVPGQADYLLLQKPAQTRGRGEVPRRGGTVLVLQSRYSEVSVARRSEASGRGPGGGGTYLLALGHQARLEVRQVLRRALLFFAFVFEHFDFVRGGQVVTAAAMRHRDRPRRHTTHTAGAHKPAQTHHRRRRKREGGSTTAKTLGRGGPPTRGAPRDKTTMTTTAKPTHSKVAAHADADPAFSGAACHCHRHNNATLPLRSVRTTYRSKSERTCAGRNTPGRTNGDAGAPVGRAGNEILRQQRSCRSCSRHLSDSSATAAFLARVCFQRRPVRFASSFRRCSGGSLRVSQFHP